MTRSFTEAAAMQARVPALAAGVLLATSIVALLSAQSTAPASTQVSFRTKVRPSLERSCLACDGEGTPSGRLDLRTRESAIKGGARGSDLIPGDAAASRLYRRVAGLERPAMPAQAAALPADQIAAIKTWIDQGAAWEPAITLTSMETRPITAEERNYWAFKLPVKAALPSVDDQRL